MKRVKYFFTSESVTMGHPDKLADQISDAILDAIYEQDNQARVAVETLLTNGLVVVAGEVTMAPRVRLNVQEVVRETIREVGYTDANYGFDYKTCGVMVAIGQQSPDISIGVTEGEGLHKEQGAGDQGLMFGYACKETPEYMPLPITLAHRLVEGLARLRQSREIPWLRPDGKSQVTVEYENDAPKRVEAIVVSAQHAPEIRHSQIRRTLIDQLIKKVIPSELLDRRTIFHVNPTGRFVTGGPAGDTGVTGRKIIVDTYGGRGSHGGGCFSGKDPSKVDRSASYCARYVAKNIVAAGLASRCELQLSYAIGVADPISVLVDSDGTARVHEEKLAELVREVFPLKPRAIIEHLELRRPIYKETARHGHFGRTGKNFTWERLDKVKELRSAAGL